VAGGCIDAPFRLQLLHFLARLVHKLSGKNDRPVEGDG
jgi:hypothetical protein